MHVVETVMEASSIHLPDSQMLHSEGLAEDNPKVCGHKLSC